MSMTRAHISISLDGYAAGPDQNAEQPLGAGGESLHAWVVELAAWRALHGMEGGEVNASTPVVTEVQSEVGAVVMGRNMFGGGPGAWDEEAPWTGWWGEEPPFHAPVFVVTHYPREPLEMAGGTTFHFVTEGPAAAVERARRAAGDQDVLVAGGAATIRSCLAAGLVHRLDLALVPVLLGSGARLLDGFTGPGFEQERVVSAPGVTHLRYRVLP
ncbi:dihydrofolate reductase [Nocardiopsis sp. Huas11]|uniref:dihydrofolate reductase family protein n=1 Tax=Nocardiopsis sp. Huas11 TaxID=2183912 RepID=UPI000EB51B73|nr:dihydrofolate reductase family protein [Nocardiopsis sp. Huas11]RKS07359.1 dihydrofolate reductase [Nocardiopsis sp. Huas11]